MTPTRTSALEITARGALSEFAWTEELQLPWPVAGRLGRELAGRPARWIMDASLCRFARLI